MSVTTSCTCSAWQDPNGEHRRSCPMWEFPARPPVTADLTPAQAARLDEVERVARAIHDTEYQPCRDGYDDCQMADHYRRLAVAAIDVMRGAADDGAHDSRCERQHENGYCFCAQRAAAFRAAVGAPAISRRRHEK